MTHGRQIKKRTLSKIRPTAQFQGGRFACIICVGQVSCLADNEGTTAMKYEIPLMELAAYAPTDERMELGNTPLEGLMMSFGCLTEGLAAYLKGLGWHYQAVNGVVHFCWDEQTRSAVEKILDTIRNEYDSYDDQITWDRLGLEGDDDVDYNGTYPEYLLEVTKNWCSL
jgi:hypothetical protein